MMRPSVWPVFAFCVFLFGCEQATSLKKWTPPEDEAIAKSYVDLLRQGKFDQIDSGLDPSVARSNATFTQMASMFPADTPKSIKVVGVHVFRNPELSRTNITLEYEFPDKWLLADVTTQRKDGVLTIVGFHVNALSDSLENLNRFTLKGKGIAQYGVLIMAVPALLLSLSALVSCVRAKNWKKNWLWIIFILLGVGRLGVNWTTGEWDVRVFYVAIPCVMATAGLYGPWTVAVSLPLGAILFLMKRERNTVLSEPSQSSTPLPPNPAD